MANTQSEQYKQLKRTVNGLVNRMAESTMEPIFTQIDELFTSNPRNDVCSLLINAVNTQTSSSHVLSDDFVAVYACVFALIYHINGRDLGATLV